MPATTESQPGRRHHIVARFHLRRFARDKSRLIGIDRTRESRVVPMSVNTACVRCGFYDIPGPNGLTGQVEDELSKIDSLGAAISSKMLASRSVVLDDRERYRFSVYMAIQIVRGVDFTRTAYAVADESQRLNREASTSEARSRVATLLGVDPTEVADGHIASGLDPAEPLPPEWWLRAAALRLGAESLGQDFFTRHWALLAVEQPSFVTSDRPIALYRDAHADGEPTGFRNADMAIMPLSRTACLLMALESFDLRSFISDVGSTTTFVNAVVGASPYEWLFHHPDDDPVRGTELPPLGHDATAEPLDYIVDGSTVRARSRIKPNLPTPPPGWVIPGRR